MKKAFKIVIYTPELDFKIGGTIVLHNLAKDLSDLGHDVRLYAASERRYDNIFCNTFAVREDIDDSTIVVYPEIIAGNPLNAKHVARWMLCDVGVHCDKDIYKTWGSDDLVFHYSSFNNKYDPRRIELLYSVWLDPAVKNKNLSRSGSCYLFKKASAFHERIKLIHPKDAILIDNCSIEEIIEIFNTREYFYCYDPYSFYDSIAALCGCIPIVYPIAGVNKLEWLKTRALFQFSMGKKNDISGLAYGEDDIPHARNTLCDVRKEREMAIEFGKGTVAQFIDTTYGYFFERKQGYPYKTVADIANTFRWDLDDNGEDDCASQIKTLKRILHEKNTEINFMKSSKFWKLREKYSQWKRRLK